MQTCNGAEREKDTISTNVQQIIFWRGKKRNGTIMTCVALYIRPSITILVFSIYALEKLYYYTQHTASGGIRNEYM